MNHPTHHAPHHPPAPQPVVRQDYPHDPMAPYAQGGYPAGYPPHHAAHPHPHTPVNIVVQNTQNAPYHGGMVRIANRQKGVAVVLAVFLGGIGAHRFYLGQTGMGIIYLFFFWTFIPAFIALFEALFLLVMPEREFDMKYNVGFRS